MTFDLNRPDDSSPIQSHLSEPHGTPGIRSTMDEAQKTVEIGQIIGFEIENGDPILMEVMEENGEIPAGKKEPDSRFLGGREIGFKPERNEE
uniref:Uncharacterized protein n=1 Tax=Lactuca sativa TaxID=4236 RepID=A0A9R1VF76_LACSA|nr:hypothetical protein LSAT_V11C500274740 [Lactuca sativa]